MKTFQPLQEEVEELKARYLLTTQDAEALQIMYQIGEYLHKAGDVRSALIGLIAVFTKNLETKWEEKY